MRLRRGMQVRALDAAAVEGARAARIERAARAGSRPGAASSLRSAARRSTSWPSAGNRAHEPRGVGMLRVVDHLLHRADLDDAARVHHRHAVGGLGDHAHVVRDQHHRRAVVAAQALQQRDDLRLDRDVERRGGLVGDDEPRIRRTGRARSPRAGACRRRTGAGSGRCAARARGCRPRASSSIARARACGGGQRQVRAGSSRRAAAPDGVERIQRRERILEDRADAPPADPAHRLGGQVVDALALEEDLAAPRCAPAARAAR